jgi:hypothetical protein
MAIFNKTELTAKGHAYLSKVLAGKSGFVFTGIKAGDGFYTDEILDLTGLVNFRLDGSIVSVKPMGKYAELECLLTNQHLAEFMELREIGIFVADPDEGEILFAYTNAGEYSDPIGPYNGMFLHEEQFTIRVYTANAANIQAELVPTTYAAGIAYVNGVSGLAADNVQGAVDELNRNIKRLYKLHKLIPLEFSDYTDSYFPIMPIDGGRLDTVWGGDMTIDGRTFDIPYNERMLVDAGGFDAEYFNDETGSPGTGTGSTAVIDGGIY